MFQKYIYWPQALGHSNKDKTERVLSNPGAITELVPSNWHQAIKFFPQKLSDKTFYSNIGGQQLFSYITGPHQIFLKYWPPAFMFNGWPPAFMFNGWPPSFLVQSLPKAIFLNYRNYFPPYNNPNLGFQFYKLHKNCFSPEYIYKHVPRH